MSSISFVHRSVLDIGGGKINEYLKRRIDSSLINAYRESRTPCLPEELFYLKQGLYIWRTLVFNPKYYQTRDEIHLFRRNGEQIAKYMPPNCTLIDLGSGNTDKVETLLSVLEKRGQPAVYLALDITGDYLQHSVSALAQKHKSVVCQGVYGTYEDAISWCTNVPSPRAFLWLGSTLFRGTRDEALASLRSWTNIMRPDDIMVVGADSHSGAEYYDKIWESYHADEGKWQELWDNGFAVANDVIGEDWFHSADWELDPIIDTASDAGAGNKYIWRHRFRFLAKRDLVLGSSGVVFRKGQEMGWLDAHKFSQALIRELCQVVGLEIAETWQAENSEMYQYLIRLKRAMN